MNLTAANGMEMAALDVFSGVFKCVRDRLMQYIAMRSVDVKDTDIQWVITVSDDWSDAAKCFIREAATLVRHVKDYLDYFKTNYKLKAVSHLVTSSIVVVSKGPPLNG